MEVEAESRKRYQGGGNAGPQRKKKKVQNQKKQPGFGEKIYSETNYFFRNGLRCVKPYYFTFTSHAKGRWVGSTVYEVFCREFQAESPAYYVRSERAIKAGKVSVNSKTADMATVICHNALVCHRVHRHEPPVSAQPLKIVHEDEHFIAINKPASIPVHPCGRYRHNSVVFILAKQHGLKNLHTIHRLDRLTSGLLLFAKSLATAQRLEEEIRKRTVEKEYLCRVQGEFPDEPVECKEPILVASHKLGVCRVDASGKPCSTLFTRLSYNGTSSVLRCTPHTGRMHQIRVHLQWLGYPIVNDPLYNHPAWGPERGRKGAEERDLSQVIADIAQTTYSTNMEESTAEKPSAHSLCEQVEGDGEKTKGEGEGEGAGVGVGGDGGKKEGRRGVGDGEGGEDGEGVQKSDEPLNSEGKVSCSKTRSNSGAPADCDKAGPSSKVEHTGKGATESATKDTSIESEPELIPSTESLGEQHPNAVSMGAGEEEWERDPDCTECSLHRPDPTSQQLMMYLHALHYKGQDWEFQTQEPDWAQPDWSQQ